MVEMIEGLLIKNIKFENALVAYREIFYYGSSKSDFTYNIENAYQSAYNALGLVLFGRDVEREILDEDDLIRLTGDFVTEAMKAYSIIDTNKPGHWLYSKGAISKLSGIEVDLQKRLEFWEWWLTEAIPQAWELAQETYKPQ